MCGISFLYNRRTTQEERALKMEACLQALVHRGPDDSGWWQNGNAVLGHRRLSIIDLSASRQPMVNVTGRFVLSYNGEIYNYKELRGHLENSWHFQTKGDTEVLLAGLVIHGTAFLDKMEGMWAFAFWDREAEKLILCRDRMGKKPLYYQETMSFLCCSSELPALCCLRDEPWQEDLDSTADYLRYGYYLPGKTAYRDVQEVLPGHFLLWSPGKQATQKPFWTLPRDSFGGSRQQACRLLRENLIRAIERRLVADVEVGAFLSGGIDSSLIVSILTKELGIHPKTFTIGFQEQSFDESHYAQGVADSCATDHYVKILKNWDRAKLADLILKNIGQPFADSSLLPTALVSSIAANHVKVALSGDGADEFFCGYQRYQARAILRWYTRLPTFFRKNFEKVVRSLPEPMIHHSNSLIKKAHLFQNILDRLEDETPYVAPVLHSRLEFAALAPDLAGRGHKPPNIPQESVVDEIEHMMIADSLVYLPQDILLKVDRASMSCSLETRAPFLDSSIVEIAFSLPRTWHCRDLQGKRMLRECFGDLLPKTIWQRRKQGFAVPVGSWFMGEIGYELERMTKIIKTPINNKFVSSMLEEHRSGKKDNGHRLWSIYVYLLWNKYHS